MKKNARKMPALNSLLLHFCLVRVRYIFLRLSLFLFCHCSRTLDSIVPLLLSAQMLRLSLLNVFLHKEKNVGWNTLARNYILHLCMTQAKSKTMNKKLTRFPRSSVTYLSCASCFSWCNAYIYLFLLCAS